MRLTIPITGTILVEGEVFGAGNLVGDPDDPVRPIDLNLGNVSWKMVSIDLEREEMVIEVEPGERVTEPTGEIDGEGIPIFRARQTTQTEKQGFLQYASELINSHTKNELYVLANRPKLKRPFKEKK